MDVFFSQGPFYPVYYLEPYSYQAIERLVSTTWYVKPLATQLSIWCFLILEGHRSVLSHSQTTRSCRWQRDSFALRLNGRTSD